MSGNSGLPAAVLASLVREARSLSLWRTDVWSGPGRAVLRLFETLSDAHPNPDGVSVAYGRAFRALADSPDIAWGWPDAWQAYVVARLVDGAPTLSFAAERYGLASVPPGLHQAGLRELAILRRLFDCGAQEVAGWAHTLAPETAPFPIWRYVTGESKGHGNGLAEARYQLFMNFAHTDDWPSLLSRLEAHWARLGSGTAGESWALRWDGRTAQIKAIGRPDPVRLEDLFAYSREHGLLAENLERFVRGLPAHDALLYGPAGSGKSSAVKALARRYAAQGLRLLEVGRDDLRALPAIAACVRDRAPKFLLFIDDFAFSENDGEYRALGTLLEGTTDLRPENLLVYATTNRFHFVPERFSDREGEVHPADVEAERRFLSDRFGLRVTFAAPDRDRYLEIVQKLALRRGLHLPKAELESRALQFAVDHGGRSARAARQWVDECTAEMAHVVTSD